MITVTRLKGGQFAVNPDLVERIHETPDTTLVMIDGSTYIVSETLTDVIDRIAHYRARVISLAYKLVKSPPASDAPASDTTAKEAPDSNAPEEQVT